MARRDRGNAATQDQPTEAGITTATEEATVPDTATEAPVASTEEEAASAAATKPEAVPINLDAFNEAFEAAIGSADPSTGDVPEEQLTTVQKAFRELDGIKAKNAAKAVVNERLKAAVNSLDMINGRAAMMVSEALTPGPSSGEKKEKVPTDPAEAYVQRVVTLALAQSLVTVPEGVDEAAVESKIESQLTELSAPAQAFLTWTLRGEDDADRGDEPDVNSTVKAAVKLALGKTAKAGGRSSGGGSSDGGPRKDIGEHIREAFAGQESGDFLTIAEIRNFKSNEYGDVVPSAGAISARLFPDSGKVSLDFIEPGTNEKGNRGAYKK